MSAFPVVKQPNILKNRSPSILSCFEFVLVNHFYFDGTKEALGTRVVVTIAFSAHTAFHLMILQEVLKIMTTILDAFVGMMNQCAVRSLAIHDICQSGNYEFSGHHVGC
jgi:hypothetical protein